MPPDNLFPSAVFIDVGGVILSPAPWRVERVLTGAGLRFDIDLVDRATYGPPRVDLGMHPDDSQDRLLLHAVGYGRRLGVPEEKLAEVTSGLLQILTVHDWFPRRPLEVIESLGEISAMGISVVIVSNADGEAAALLDAYGICQVGPGRGVPVTAIVDSGVVGVAKPDPAIYQIALDILGLEGGAVVHVGDSVANDVDCVRSVGITPVHFDPYGLCGLPDHAHTDGMPGFARMVHAGPWTTA